MKLNKYMYLVFLGVAATSLSPIITKISTVSSLTISANRMLYTIIILTPFVFKKILIEIPKISYKHLYLTILSGIFLALHFWSWIESLNHTSIANATLLVNLHPIFILFISSLVLNEKIYFSSIASTIIAIFGSMLILYNSLSSVAFNLSGDVLAIFGAFTVSIYFIVGAKIRRYVSTTSYTYIAYSTAFITLFIISLFTNVNIFSYTLKDMYVFIGLAIIPTLLGHSIFNMALKYISPHIISMANLGEPILATILAYYIYAEKINSIQFVGGLFIILGLAIRLRPTGNNS